MKECIEKEMRRVRRGMEEIEDGWRSDIGIRYTKG